MGHTNVYVSLLYTNTSQLCLQARREKNDLKVAAHQIFRSSLKAGRQKPVHTKLGGKKLVKKI